MRTVHPLWSPSLDVGINEHRLHIPVVEALLDRIGKRLGHVRVHLVCERVGRSEG